MSNKTYPYVTITGTLTCKSDLHLGDGDIQNFSNERSGKIIEGKVNTVCTSNNKPYLPGSSLRGSLTARLNRNDDTIKKLFGYTDEHGETKRGSSKIRIIDATISSNPSTENKKLPYWDNTRNTWVRHAIAIDNVTGTTDQHKFFRYELIPTGTQFKIELKGEKLTEKEINLLLSLLKNRWNNSTENSLGKGKSKGYGKIQWELSKVEVVDQAALKAWITNSKQEKPPYKQLEETSDTPRLNISDYEKEQHQYQKIQLIIKPQSPLLVHEPAYVKENKNDNDNNAKITYARKGNKAIIYPSTLKGAARAHASRIIATIAHAHYGVDVTDAAKITKPLLKNLFGSTKQRGNIHFSEATSDVITKEKEHKQFFNAIDRFTGKVKKGALYNVEAVDCETLTAPLNIQQDKLEEADKGILYFLVRDAINGEIAIGWGKSRGYGEINIQLKTEGNTEIKTTEDFIAWLGEEKIQTWLTALHHAIKELSALQQPQQGEAHA